MKLACHFSFGQHGETALLDLDTFEVTKIKNDPPSGSEKDARPILIHADSSNCYVFSPQTQKIHKTATLTEDTWAAYPYYDPRQPYAWYVVDGDKETGDDRVQCGDGSPVIIFKKGDAPEHVKTICMGKGHHVVAFVYPGDKRPDMPKLAFVSNLLDASIRILNNDPDSGDFLKHLHTFELGEGAFPHGMVYSDYTGYVYNLNNGFGTISVMDPLQNKIIDSIEMKVASNLLLSPDGRYIIGKGADRKSDPDHVIGRLSILDLQSHQIIHTVDLNDIYPSTYKFQAGRLYVTTAQTGKGAQKDRVITDRLLVFNSDFESFRQIQNIEVGKAECSRRPIAFFRNHNDIPLILVPNVSEGSLTILNGDSGDHLKTVSLCDLGAKEVTFSLWGDLSGT